MTSVFPLLETLHELVSEAAGLVPAGSLFTRDLGIKSVSAV
jgi:hypothetical protein